MGSGETSAIQIFHYFPTPHFRTVIVHDGRVAAEPNETVKLRSVLTRVAGG